MASDYNVNSAVQLNSDSGAAFAMNKAPVEAPVPYTSAEDTSTSGRVKKWRGVQPGTGTFMDFGDKPQVTPPQSYGS